MSAAPEPNPGTPGPPMRRPRRSDARDLAELANDWAIAKNLRDAFPHPYTLADAEGYLERCESGAIPHSFAITVDDRLVGGCGLKLQQDIERCSAEIGYWVGTPYWGRGLATAAVGAVTEYAFEQLGLLRVYALPFAHNAASARVLEKAGFVREGVLRNAAIKAGRPVDMIMYAVTREP